MDSALYAKLLAGGGYTLPYLVRMWNDHHDFRFINDNVSLTYGGNTYAASNFTFVPSDDGDSTFEIEAADNQMISLLDSELSFRAEFVGVLMEDGTVQEMRSWNRRYGRATWTGKSATVTFSSDDRLSMAFPSLVYNGDNNRGNA